MNIHIVNGPNLNLLGRREPELYGAQSFEEYLQETLRPSFPQVELTYFQSNIEGELINNIQQQGFAAEALILNLGGYSHTSVALSDALRAVPCRKVEVHLTNLHARETHRHQSLTGASCIGVISGFGLDSYRLAVAFLVG
jgi:3-dehydroquinate dehydratase-2